MKPTPTDSHCPSLDDLMRLHHSELPEGEAAHLYDHLNTCPSCRRLWQKLQSETLPGQTPPVLQPIEDTNIGQPARPAASSAIAWSSEFGLEGPGGQRPPASGAPPTPLLREFSFLSPPQEKGGLGWLAHYRISGVLGEGGMGYVFDAFDTHLHRRVALKVLKPNLAANDTFRERFLKEARAAAALPDEYIITIYQVGLENDVPFLAMKFLYGESLEQRLERDNRLPIHEILRIGRETALGLSAAHERGLIHRDIKPANLWLETPPPTTSEPGTTSSTRLSCEYQYRVKILDFGLARPVNDSRRLTATGLIVGTPQYLAPEQARGQPLDHRCDLFSLGIVLYRMATGALPFEGADTLAQLTALAIAEPPPIEELAPDVPVELRQLIHQLLERDPAKRPPTARAVAESLRALEKSETLPAASPSRLGEPGRTKPKPPGSRRLQGGQRWLLAAGFLALLLAGGVFFWRGQRPASEAESAPVPANAEPIKVGILFSQRGTLRNGGSAAHDAAQFALDELNKQGGLLGRTIEAVQGDGESDYRKFEAQAEKLILKDKVCAIFGTRASANRKAIRPIVEKHDNLLFYPMQFEGLEDSPNIIYLGAVPNQQMFPAVDFMLGSQRKRRILLVGSDYVFPRAANAILSDYIKKKFRDVEILDEKYVPLGGSEVKEIIEFIKEKKPDLVVNTINGDTNSAFFRELYQAKISAENTPVLSFSLGENDLLSIGEAGAGHYLAWSYFQSIDRPENRAFVERFQKYFRGSRLVVSDPMETVYFGIHLWARAVQAAGTVDPRAVREKIKGLSFEAPEGSVRVDPDTHYTWRVMRLGRVQKDGQLDILIEVKALPPVPFPGTRKPDEWKGFLHKLYIGWGNRWVK